jgi:hypothetical protein
MARPGRFELPTLCLEGRRSIQLSYGRAGYVDSKSFIVGSDTILDSLTFYRKGRGSMRMPHQRTLHNLDQAKVLRQKFS